MLTYIMTGPFRCSVIGLIQSTVDVTSGCGVGRSRVVETDIGLHAATLHDDAALIRHMVFCIGASAISISKHGFYWIGRMGLSMFKAHGLFLDT